MPELGDRDKENVTPEESAKYEEAKGAPSLSPKKSEGPIDDALEFDMKYHLIDPKDFHLVRVKNIYLNKCESGKVKKNARKEQHMLVEFYRVHKDEIESKQKGIERVYFRHHLHELLKDHEEIFDNLSKYLIFSVENKRFFDTKL